MKQYKKLLFLTMIIFLAFVLVANPTFADGAKASQIRSGNTYIENQVAGDETGQEFNGDGEGSMHREIANGDEEEEEGGDDGEDDCHVEEPGGDDEEQGGDEEDQAGAEGEKSWSGEDGRFDLFTRFGWGASDFLYDYEIDDWSNQIKNSILASGVYGNTMYVFTIPKNTEISRHDGNHVSGVFFSAIDGNIITSTFSEMIFSNPVTVYICEGSCYKDVYGNWFGGILKEIGSFTEIVDFTAIIE